jgi:S1-C subfamily serine protease
MAQEDRPFRGERASGTGINWLLAILLILLAGFLWRGAFISGRGSGSLFDPTATEPPVVARGDLAEDEKSTIDLFRRASPAVVNITSIAEQRDLFSLDVMQIPQGSGSGFVWDESGYIVTNYHVVENSEIARVTLADRSTWEARRVGTAPDKDIAVLKVEAPAERLQKLNVGASANLQVGQKVFAIGNPFGFDHTLTTGVISGLGREIASVTRRPLQGVIQIDAAINPGNSGGPLLDSAGLLIGMNTAIYSPSGASAGIGFAVPVDTIRRIVPKLIRDGKVDRIGIGVSPVEDAITARLGFKGVLVREISEKSPAQTAGLRPTRRGADGSIILGDLIVAVDGKPVGSTTDLYRIIDQREAGDRLKLTVIRDKQQHEVEVTLGVLN